MTKIKDIFPIIFTGVNVRSYSSSTGKTYKIFNKDALKFGILDSTKFNDFISDSINDKYELQGRDVVISLKKPFIAATLRRDYQTIIVQNNFAILRGINTKKYSYIFVTNYLNNIWLPKYLESHSNLSLQDIEEIEIPDIPKTEQMNITKLCEKLNERDMKLLSILDNDKNIIKLIIDKITKGEE